MQRALKIRLAGRAGFAEIRARMGMRLSIADRAALFLGAILDWREARWTLADRTVAVRRREVCLGEPCWRSRPFPHCSVCGCTAAKFLLPSARCPRGLW